jgi:hypothetical protein
MDRKKLTVILSLGVLVLAFGGKAVAYENCKLSEFLAAQGKTIGTFFAGFPDITGWVDAVDPNTELPTTFGIGDYAGVWDDLLEDVDTEVRGRIACNDNDVSVVLRTEGLIAFAQSVDDLQANNFDFDATPTIFGEKPADVAAGAEPAIGNSNLAITFTKDPAGCPTACCGEESGQPAGLIQSLHGSQSKRPRSL